METNNLYCMCRLCLFRNKNLIDIFEMNSLHGYVVAEIISDLLSLQVTEDDGYPRVVCERCLEKLNEFKVFKEVCYTLKSTYDNLFCNRRASSQNEVVNIEPLVKLEPEENDAKESEDYHEAMYPNPEIIMCDRISELNSQSEILVEQEGISSDEMSLSSVVKEEPKEEEIEVMESQPKELFHVSGDEFGDPVRQNVIFHSQMSMGSVHSVPSSHNHLEQREDSTGETLQNIGEGQNSSCAKKYRKLTLEEKWDLLKFLENHSERQAAAQYGISKTTVNGIKKRKEEYLSLREKKDLIWPPKRRRSSEFEEVNKLTLEWLRDPNLGKVSLWKVQDVARSFAKELNLPHFKASHSWLNKFRKMYNISFEIDNVKVPDEYK